MARVSKTCNSQQCGGTKQPVQIVMDPGDPSASTPDNTVVYHLTCLTCAEDHPPDANFVVADGKAWAKAHKAVHGRIPIPLQEHP